MRVRAVVLVPVLTVLLIACGGNGQGVGVDLSADAREGRTIAKNSGCVACHGQNGEGGVGPTWQGLAGSAVELTDGSTKIADDDYLTTSIMNPSARLRAGYTVKMPVNNLGPEDIAKIVAYIEELS
jgi:cytochrome c oxidase subunit 2